MAATQNSQMPISKPVLTVTGVDVFEMRLKNDIPNEAGALQNEST
jgi:hypothetical protein